MPTVYSPDFVELEDQEFGDLEYQAVGRIVRACAKIEDLVSLFIAQQLKISEGAVTIVLGQTPISKKMSIAGYLASVASGEPKADWDRCQTPILKEVLSCRNALAHGVMLGRSKSDRWAFLTAKTEEPTSVGKAVQIVISFTTTDLMLYAEEASTLASNFESNLGLGLLLRARLGQSLEPHRRSQPKAKRTAEPKRPPQS